MNEEYAAQIRIGIKLARDLEWGDYGIQGWVLAGEMLILKAFGRERGNMRKRAVRR